MTTALPLSADLIAEANARDAAALDEDYASLGRQLEGRGIAVDAVMDRVAGFSVAVPSRGAGRGGTRFASVPIFGEPTDIHEKQTDFAVVDQLFRATPRVSPHFPRDKVSDDTGSLITGSFARAVDVLATCRQPLARARGAGAEGREAGREDRLKPRFRPRRPS